MAERGLVLGDAHQFAPGDQLDALLLKQLAEFGAGEEIEIALAPSGAPSVALARGRFHFVIGESEMDDEFSDAGLNICEGSLVKLGPFFWRNSGRDSNSVVEDDISGGQAGLQIRMVGKPIAPDEDRQFVFVGKTENDFEDVLAIFVQAILVGIKVGGTDAHGVGAIDLRAKLQLDLVRVDFWGRVPVVTEVAVLVDQARDSIFRSDGAPAVIDTLAGQRKVETEIDIGMRLGIIGNFRKPRAGNHNARGVDESGVESLDGCRVHGVSDANVVGVNDQEFCIAGKTEAFGQSFASVLGMGIKERASKKKDEEQDDDTVLIPKKTVVHGEDSLSLDAWSPPAVRELRVQPSAGIRSVAS
jgi:hypothetical protein